jgi:hypothetical protein
VDTLKTIGLKKTKNVDIKATNKSYLRPLPMSYLIPENEIHHLASLVGIAHEKHSQRIKQANEIEKHIIFQISNSVEFTWDKCFPTWHEFGRVQSLSPCKRVTRYSPSYATVIGLEFAAVYRDKYAFIINILDKMPFNSYEYLCAYDLLEMIAVEFWRIDQLVPEQIFDINLPVPPVIKEEVGGKEQYLSLETVGQFLHQSFLIEYGDHDE